MVKVENKKTFSRKKVTKVAFADMQKFVRNCSDSSVKKEYQLAISEGIQYIMLAVDENNKNDRFANIYYGFFEI